MPVLPAALRAQFTTDVKVVNLFANVRDKKDQIVRGLTKTDFLLDEEGKPQKSAIFPPKATFR